jgi:hypothetical protein
VEASIGPKEFDARRLDKEMRGAAEDLFDLIGGGLILRAVGKVDLERKNVFPLDAVGHKIFDGLVKSLLADVRYRDPSCPPCRKPWPGRGPAPDRASRDKDYFAGKIFHFFAPLL